MLADEFWAIAHDEHSGAPHAPVPVIALSLGSALLAEMILDQRIRIHLGRLGLMAMAGPRDPLLAHVHAAITNEQRMLDVHTWLAYLATFVYPQMGQRLAAAGRLRAEPHWTMRGRRYRYRPTDWQRAAWASARLAERIMRRQPLSPGDLYLSALAKRASLLDLMLRDFDNAAAGRAYLEQLEPHIWAPLLELLNYTDAAMANAMVTHRT